MSHSRVGVLYILALAVLVLGASTAGTSAQTTFDVTGAWAFEVQTEAGTGTPVVTFKQDGEKLTGHYSSATLGEADLTGTVKGEVIAFSFTVSIQGTTVEIAYSGIIENKDSMKGKAVIVGLGEGTFTAKRK